MSGLIRTHHLVTCLPAIVGEFGWRTYARCVCKALFAPRPVTFLECIALGVAAEPRHAGRDEYEELP
jgi:hypothetical protein